jgi:hypothetical protein
MSNKEKMLNNKLNKLNNNINRLKKQNSFNINNKKTKLV